MFVQLDETQSHWIPFDLYIIVLIQLFDRYKIALDDGYEEHLNKYHVIYLDIAGFVSDHAIDIREKISSAIREAVRDPDVQKRYLRFLRELFKNGNFTPFVVAAAYMTGILPIKKDGSQSGISDFQEYSILEPEDYSEYVGFTEEEVELECRKTGRNFESMKKWYDGYTVGNQRSVYNPYSVIQAAVSGKYKSYWRKTSAAETLMTYIDMDMDGLQEEIVRLIAGETVEVNPDSFQNDIETFTCRDDVLTLLVHLGYLTYEEVSNPYDDDDQVVGLARIPNKEVLLEFEHVLRNAKHESLVELVRSEPR